MKAKKQTVYLVGDCGPEHNYIRSIHKSYKGALKAWDKLRLELLKEAKKYLNSSDKWGKEMYETMVKNLSCKDPDKIDNYPHETPYINKMELKE